MNAFGLLTLKKIHFMLVSANANGMFSESTDVDMGNKSVIKYTLGCTGQSQVMTRQKMEPKCTSSENTSLSQ